MMGIGFVVFFFSLSLFGAEELVDVQKVDGTIRVNLIYATQENEAKRKLYASPECWLRRPVAEALARVQAVMRLSGTSLSLRDCYRPLGVHQSGVAVLKRESKVSERHSRGMSVDVALIDASGSEVGLPETGVRKLKKMALRRATKQSAFLRKTLEKEGFVSDGKSPWHYDFKGWETSPVMEVPFPDQEG